MVVSEELIPKPIAAADQHDADNVALCSWKEARGDGEEAMRAVMHVIVNRAGHPGFARTIHDVIYGKNQFSSMSIPSDPEFNLQPWPGDSSYRYCLGVVRDVLNGSDIDPTNGAHYYDNPKSETSGWFERVIVADRVNHPLLGTIGKQSFYR